MRTVKAIEFAQGELDRTILEVRVALGKMAVEQRISGACAGLLNFVDQSEFAVVPQSGDDAFIYDGTRVSFRLAPFLAVWNALNDLAEEIGLDPAERLRAQQAGINQFVLHEILHIRQNMADFGTVQTVKNGLPGIGLPMMDLAADTVAAWIVALVESHRLEEVDDDNLLGHFAHALLVAYVIGAFVFDARTNPLKRQRAIGLIVSLALVRAKLDGSLDEKRINEEWTPISPVLAHDISKTHRFNAIVISTFPGLLIEDRDIFDGDSLNELWEQVGRSPVRLIVTLVGSFLKASGAIKS